MVISVAMRWEKLLVVELTFGNSIVYWLKRIFRIAHMNINNSGFATKHPANTSVLGNSN